LLQTTTPKVLFLYHWVKNELTVLAGLKKPVDQAKTAACSSCLATVKVNCNDTQATMNANKYLSPPDEEMAFLQIICGLADRAKGVMKQEAMAMIDDLVNENVNRSHQVECSEKVFQNMLERHPDLVKIISARLLDPTRARKSTRTMRDAVFYKLDAYIRNLHCMGKVS
jgi:hypothetical protein